jgi:DNA-3-methyladenine glycosylase II
MKTIATLNPTAPYNFDLLLDLLARFAHPVVDVVYDGAYWRALHSGDGLALLRVDSVGSTHKPELRLSLVNAIGDIDEFELIRDIGFILNIHADHSDFYQIARADSTLWRVVDTLQGISWLRTATVHEALMTTIIEQQIAWTTAQRAQRWLVEWGGHAIPHNGVVHYAFPPPPQIAASTIEELTPLKITFKRMGVMIDISRKIVSGEFDLESLRIAPPEVAYNTLIQFKGIGHWTAAWTIQRTQGGHNYVGHNDVALQAAVNHYFFGGVGRIPAQQVLDAFAPYGDFAGLAAHYTMLRWVLDRYEANAHYGG